MGKPCDPGGPCWCWASGRSLQAPSPASAGTRACGLRSDPLGAAPPPSAAICRMATSYKSRPSDASAPGRPGPPALAGNTASSARLSAAGIAPRSADQGRPGRPARDARLGSWPGPFSQKIPLHRQLADLLIQRCQLSLRRIAVARRWLVPPKQRRRAVQQRLLPRMDLAGMDPKLARQLGYGALLADRRERHLRLKLRTVLLPCI